MVKINNPSFQFVPSDINDRPELDLDVLPAGRIYHLAAVVGMFGVLREPGRVTQVNVCATERLLGRIAAAGHLPQMFIASSSSLYSHSHNRELREDDELVYLPRRGGLTGYALSKQTNQIQAMAYREQYGPQLTIPQLFNAVGPRQHGNYGFVLPRFIRQALAGEVLAVFRDGTQTRSFCDVRDTVAAIDLLPGNSEAAGQPVNVDNERETRILDLVRLVIERSGSRSGLRAGLFRGFPVGRPAVRPQWYGLGLPSRALAGRTLVGNHTRRWLCLPHRGTRIPQAVPRGHMAFGLVRPFPSVHSAPAIASACVPRTQPSRDSLP